MALVYFVFKKIDLSDFFIRLDSVQYSWIIFSIFISLLDHIIRAYRWNILMKDDSDSLSTYITTNIIIVSYFTALIFPRLNDFVRCYLISKTNTIKLSTSLGTVVSERIIDLVSLFILGFLLLLLEYEIFVTLLIDLFSNTKLDLYSIILILFITIVALYIFSLFLKRNKLISKTFNDFKSGFFAFKNVYYRADFLLSTLFLWIIYYLMGYIIFFSLPETSHLGFNAGLSILVAGTLGMIVPVNAGIGAYHFLVASILLNYGISYEGGLFFATLIHGSQVVALLFFGFISSILLFTTIKKNRG